MAAAFALLNFKALNLACQNNANNRNRRGGRGGRGVNQGEEGVNVMFTQWEHCQAQGLSYGEPMAVTFQFVHNVLKDADWVILDTGSTCSGTNNKHLLSNLHDTGIQVVTNAGSHNFSEKGTFELFPLDIYYHGESLTTVVSFHKLQCVDGLRIHYDSDIEDIFHVEHNDDVYDFVCGGGGLYYYVMPPAMDKTKEYVTQYSLYSTVTSNKAFFSNQEVKHADTAS